MPARRALLAIAFVALLFAPMPALNAAPASQTTIRAMELLSPLERKRLAALEWFKARGNKDAIPALIQTLRFEKNNRRELLDALEALGVVGQDHVLFGREVVEERARRDVCRCRHGLDRCLIEPGACEEFASGCFDAPPGLQRLASSQAGRFGHVVTLTDYYIQCEFTVTAILWCRALESECVMSNWLYRIGLFSSRHRRWVVAGWVLLAFAAVMANRTVDAGTVDNFEVPGVESQEAVDLLDERFPERAGATAMVVFYAEDGFLTDTEAAAGIAATVAEVQSLPEVLGITEPLAGERSISPDGSTAFAAVQFKGSSAELGRETLDDLFTTAAPAEAVGVQVEYGGELPTILKERSTGPAEAIGIIAAMIILFFAFRSFYSAALPLRSEEHTSELQSH